MENHITSEAMRSRDDRLMSRFMLFLSLFFLIPACIPLALKPFAAQTPPSINLISILTYPLKYQRFCFFTAENYVQRFNRRA